MQKIKTDERLLAILIAVTIIFSMLPTLVVNAADPIARYNGVDYLTLTEAINAVPSSTGVPQPATITILKDATYNTTITISNRDITFDLQNFDLNLEVNHSNTNTVWVSNARFATIGMGNFSITNNGTSGTGLAVEGTSVVTITADVNANTASHQWGIFATDNSNVTVNGNAAASRVGIEAWGNSTITVNGNVTGNSFGVYADSNATVTVNGNVVAPDNYGVYAQHDSQITVNGDVTATEYGIHAENNSIVMVNGNVNSSDSGVYATDDAKITVSGNVAAESFGVQTFDTAVVTVDGNVTAHLYGVLAYGEAEVTIGGELKVPSNETYIEINGHEFSPTDGNPCPKKTGFRLYTHDSAFVWVRAQGNPPKQEPTGGRDSDRYLGSARTTPTPTAKDDDEDEEEEINHYRLVAYCPEGKLLGGRFNPETGEMEFRGTPPEGEYEIVYVPHLRRLVLTLTSPLITDLAGNAPTQHMDVLPKIDNGRTLVPLRFIANALGANISWNDATQEVTLILDGKILTFAIGETAPGMDIPAQLVDGRTLVPLRFICEFFGAIVTWCDDMRDIEIIMD
jgi:hypothetical protein